MKVAKITLENWKGLTGTMEFHERDVLIANNGAGKSAWTEGLMFALFGFARNGRRLDDAFAYASDSQTSVMVEMDDGFMWTREMVKDHKKKSVKETILIPGVKIPEGQKKLKVEDARGILAERVAPFLPAFDLGEFLDLSVERRREFVLKLCAHDAGSPADLMTRVKLAWLMEKKGEEAVLTFCMKDPDELTAEELSTAVEKMWNDPRMADWREAANPLAKILQDEAAGELSGALQTMLARCKEAKSASKSARDKAEQAAKKLADERAKQEVQASTGEQIRTKIAEREEQGTKLREDMARDEQANQERARTHDRLDRINAAIASLEKEATGPAREYGLEIRQGQEKVAKLHEEVKAIELPSITAAREEELKHRALYDANLSTERQALDALDDANRVERSAEQAFKAAEEDPWNELLDMWSVVKEENKLEGAQVQDVQAFIESRLIGDVDLLQGKLMFSRTAIAAADIEAQKAKKKKETSGGALAKARGAYETVADEREKLAKGIETRMHEIARIERTVESTSREMEAHQAAEGTRLDRLKDATAEKVEEERRLAELPVVDHSIINHQLNAVTGDVGVMKLQLRKAEQAAAVVTELAKCEVAAEEEQTAHDVAKQAEAAVKVLREQIMYELVRPLLNHLQVFLEASVQKSAYCTLESDRGRPLFEIGWEHDGKRRSLETMSSGEGALFCAGLTAAMAAISQSRLQFLPIEADHMDRHYRVALLKGLDTVKGFGNILVLSAEEFDEVPEGWRVTDMVRVGV